MIAAVNAMLECFMTGLFTALILFGLAKAGYMPMLLITKIEEEEERE